MKIKFTILALCACSIAILPAQTAAPEKSAADTPAAEEPKAETPVEKQAFKIFGILEGLPTIMGSIKDDASLAAAETKLDDIFKKLKVEETALLKLDIPDNEARKKISAKMEIKQKALGEKMMQSMMGFQQLPPSTMQGFGVLMEGFSSKMQKSSGAMDKYFTSDEEQAAKKGE